MFTGMPQMPGITIRYLPEAYFSSLISLLSSHQTLFFDYHDLCVLLLPGIFFLCHSPNVTNFTHFLSLTLGTKLLKEASLTCPRASEYPVHISIIIRIFCFVCLPLDLSSLRSKTVCEKIYHFYL